MAGLISNWAAIAIAFIALIFTILNAQRNSRKDTVEAIEKDDAKFDSLKESMIKANTKLDTLCGTANETRADVKSTAKDIMQIQSHMSAIDERISAIDKRLTDLEDHVYNKTG